MKSRATAAILAFVLSFIGGHNFYLGRTGRGVLSILFCWTYIPTIVSIIDAIILLTMSDQQFNVRYNQLLLGTNTFPGAPQQNMAQSNTQAQNVTINLGAELEKLKLGTQATIEQEKCYIEQIEQLSDLHQRGILTDDEFASKKQALLK
jgi:TM2 domain-containing membrane protein YozV